MIKTQKDLVMKHLINHGSISSWEAIQKYRITRLGAIIFTLKQEGVDIGGKMEHNKKGNHWKRYSLTHPQR